jgi:hypothetical protein
MLIKVGVRAGANAAIHAWRFADGTEADVQWCKAGSAVERVHCQARLNARGRQALEGFHIAHNTTTRHTIQTMALPRLQCLASRGSFIVTGSGTGEVTTWLSISCSTGEWQLQPLAALRFEAVGIVAVQIVTNAYNRMQAVACLSDGRVAIIGTPLRCVECGLCHDKQDALPASLQ